MPFSSTVQPKPWRVVLGFLVAPLIPALLFAHLTDDFALFWSVLLGTYGPALAAGVPAYFFLQNQLRLRVAILMLAGGIIAVLPWLTLMLLNPVQQESFGNCVAVLDGHTTWCGFKRNGAI